MNEDHTRGEMHGCIVCGRLYQLYVVYDASGKFVDCKVMSAGGRRVMDRQRPLVACEKHSPEQVEAALGRVFGPAGDEDALL